jgi:hypothetical protein
VASDGTNHLVVWDDLAGDGIQGARVTPQGAVLDPTGIEVHAAAGLAGIAPASGGFLVVGSVAGRGRDVDAVQVSSAGTVGEPTLLTMSANSHDEPAVAFDGTNYLVVWSDDRAGETDIYAARVAPDGTVLDPTAFAVTTAAGWQEEPVVTFDGTNFFVVWIQRHDRISQVTGARVSPGGAVLDPGSIPISAVGDDQYSLALSSDGTSTLVAWQEGRFSDGVIARRVSASGAVLGDRITIAPADGNCASAPGVAYDGTNFLVAASVGDELTWTRVSPTGQIIDRNGLTVGNCSRPAVAFNGTDYLVTWTAGDYDNNDIYATRVTPAGAALDPQGIPITTAPGDQDDPKVAVNGSFLVVWTENRFGDTDVYGARIDGTGRRLDGDGFAIAAGPEYEGRHEVTAGPGETFGVVSQAFAPEAPYGSTRTFLRTVAPK